MSKFEVGDKVRRVRGGRHVDMKEGDVGTVEAVVMDGGNLIIQEFQRPGWSHSAENFELVTTAPLDPSKVKAGDMVTLTKGETSVRGPVTGISYAGGGEWDFRVGEEPYRRTGRVGLWAVTAHQPAPEPEREWKPGTVWADQEGEHYWYHDNGNGGVFRDGRAEAYMPHDMGDVRPLVVIDPAAVDVHDLAIHNGLRDVSVRNLLADLGIVER